MSYITGGGGWELPAVRYSRLDMEDGVDRMQAKKHMVLSGSRFQNRKPKRWDLDLKIV